MGFRGKHEEVALGQLIVSGLSQEPQWATSAIKKLSSHSLTLPRAASLFDHLHHPDAFHCNTIIRAYARNLDFPNALRFYYHKMLARSLPPNHYTFPLFIKLCTDFGAQPEGLKAHARIVKFGFGSDLFARNALIRMYSVFGRVGHARMVFDEGSDVDLVSYNSLIDGYVKNGEIGAARQVFDGMSERDVLSWNCMVAGYVGVGDLDAANELFETMPERDVVSWNCMIDGCARVGNVSLAVEFFNRVPVAMRNVVTWNLVLALHARVKNYGECLRLFGRMMEGREVMPNKATLVSVLTACANLGMLGMGMWVHSFIRSNDIKPDVLLSTCLLTMYAKCGAMDLARGVFDEMPVRSVVSWNSMIMGYGLHGNGDKALELFLDMEKTGVQPNDATFISVLSACTHAGMVMEGLWYFDLMRRVYKIEPKVEHYGCMVDLLARAGLVEISEELIRKVPVKAGSAIWGALLSGCSTHLNSELGEIVAKRLIELDPQDIGPYILLSNMYAAQGRWDDVERVRLMIEEKGLQREAASSLVQLEDFESKYFVKNNSGYRKRMMYSMLSELREQMKLSIEQSIKEDNFVSK
ncbi:pentatricopeptide repeat-containing protein At3g29230 [Cajanus cajan]|uniref:pentatricopeptide repeat-containing protein At3g29230 n=1 Tax=Cajanus cajan TaxID=3821 RepID=UPI00098D7BFA|nr:pentatricopeptide repeat-containing protein At3g29230 [Cajanus cajan]